MEEALVAEEGEEEEGCSVWALPEVPPGNFFLAWDRGRNREAGNAPGEGAGSFHDFYQPSAAR